MTRVNSAIPVKLLCDELLLAEHREIKRLPKVLEKSLRTRGLCNIPESFVLGTGHVKCLEKAKDSLTSIVEYHTKKVEFLSNIFSNTIQSRLWLDIWNSRDKKERFIK